MSNPNYDDKTTPLDFALADYMQRQDRGEPIDVDEFIAQYPDVADELRDVIAGAHAVQRMLNDVSQPRMSAGGSPPLDVVRYFGDYELLEELGRGAMGIVYKARQASVNRIVAVKMILSGRLASEAEVRRFYSEAEAAANLDHPGIVPIFEVGQHRGQHYFSMGYLDGESLRERLMQGPLAAGDAARIMLQVAEAVAYAHANGVIHRDLKPANIMIDAEGHVRVMDFGLAKRIEGERDLTVAGHALGTPSYMPPEQAAGRIREIDARSDVYALGATLYALLTGHPPFQAESTAETLLQCICFSSSIARAIISRSCFGIRTASAFGTRSSKQKTPKSSDRRGQVTADPP